MSTALATPAMLAAVLLAIAPRQLRGASVRMPAGTARDAWIDTYSALAEQALPIRLPPSVTDEALEGGLDLSATLTAGMPIYRSGAIQAAAGRTLLLAMAERWSCHTAARIAAAIDRSDDASAFTVIALDEGIDDEERPPQSLLDRVAFRLSDVPASPRDWPVLPGIDDIAEARARLPTVRMADDVIELLVDVADRMGVTSNRALRFAVHAARAHASLMARATVEESDVSAAAALVLAPRATTLPASLDERGPRDEQPEDDVKQDVDECSSESLDSTAPHDRIVAACAANLPKNLLDGMEGAAGARPKSERGKKSVSKISGRQGRSVGVRKGIPRRGERLSLLATLLAAAPWQRLRQHALSRRQAPSRPFYFSKDDLRLYRHKSTQRATTIFSVDASGSSAAHRLAEAKGAVEQLLAQSYVRRDKVALIAFRARRAEVLLHPTRSLARARRALADLPGGGATPLASGIREAHGMAGAVLRSGQQCHVVLLTDGCANVDTEGRAGRGAALDEALLMARRLRADGIASLVIDISPKPGQQSLVLAEALGARYVPLPHGSAENISETVRQFGRVGRG